MIYIASILSQFPILCFKHLNILLHSLIHLVRLLYLLLQLKNVFLTFLYTTVQFIVVCLKAGDLPANFG